MVWNLDHPLLQLSRNDVWTIGDSLEGVQIFGASGSGKTSGSGAAIAKKFLAAGYGGLVLTAKNDEIELWREYFTAAGRSQNDLVLFPEGDLAFDFLRYESQFSGQAGFTDNLAKFFTSLVQLEQAGELSKEQYWMKAMHELIVYGLMIIRHAPDGISLRALADLVNKLPKDKFSVDEAPWQSFLASLLPSWHSDADALDARRYFEEDFATMYPKQRDGFVAMFRTLATTLLTGELRKRFGTGLVSDRVRPEECYWNGKVIIMNLPVREYKDSGRFSQILYKAAWQRAMDRRSNSRIVPTDRPVFLWADESQEFVTTQDGDFQSTARSARVATVYLTQNLPQYKRKLKSEDEVAAFLGLLKTKIVHCNDDESTPSFQDEQFQISFTGASPSADFAPLSTTELRQGGPKNNWKVDGILFKAGQIWNATGTPQIKVTFHQHRSE